MGEIIITVRGEKHLEVPAERATVHALVTFDGPEPAPVHAATLSGVASIREQIEALHDPRQGPVVAFSVAQVRITAHRPWNERGEQLPLVHRAAVGITSEFVDFTELGRWIVGAARVAGFQVEWIDWDLTPERRADVERRARQDAVRDAQRRAQDYADALDLGAVRIRTISDEGIRRQPLMEGAAMRSAGPESDLDLTPEPIDIDLAVEASFAIEA